MTSITSPADDPAADRLLVAAQNRAAAVALMGLMSGVAPSSIDLTGPAPAVVWPARS